ncbi:hypothetical protein SAMN04488065_0951 [Haloplanus vescus]|uniref:Uncharacterized protein n=1 Tax=Haloplanus vescus TaxID=555874 RepID=A0A1H3WN07_9EURY|nr:hypothetical protein [Haloplanus vescus]SDZ87744.1 hypothetical protein SAMN04488065_0951 [Haloplanus vescus]
MTTDTPISTADDSSLLGLTWYHHAVAFAYSVSAAVSASPAPLDRLAVEFVGSLLGAYIVVVLLTFVWRRVVPRFL